MKSSNFVLYVYNYIEVANRNDICIERSYGFFVFFQSPVHINSLRHFFVPVLKELESKKFVPLRSQ